MNYAIVCKTAEEVAIVCVVLSSSGLQNTRQYHTTASAEAFRTVYVEKKCFFPSMNSKPATVVRSAKYPYKHPVFSFENWEIENREAIRQCRGIILANSLKIC